MKIIRIKGLIAFVVVSALIFGAWTLLVDGAVKKLIESGGTSIVGSKVELQKADLSISPLGLTLKGLDITDPDNPMVNMIHVDKISFLMAFERLLLGKVIINEMLIDGVKTGTPRKISGAIRKEKRESKDKDAAKGFSTAFSMPSLDVPNIDDILT
ncbi:MAG: hypothetical protein OEV42_06725, partial [Deltaproteobacteria bacterium]|nr:hypothetical protein [Deltaproteobacteria bacterium]